MYVMFKKHRQNTSYEHNTQTCRRERCRLCSKTGPFLCPLFCDEARRYNIVHKIHKCTGLTLQEGDCLPQKICCICVTVLLDFYDYRTKSLHSDKIFRRRSRAPSRFSRSLKYTPESLKSSSQLSHSRTFQHVQTDSMNRLSRCRSRQEGVRCCCQYKASQNGSKLHDSSLKSRDEFTEQSKVPVPAVTQNDGMYQESITIVISDSEDEEQDTLDSAVKCEVTPQATKKLTVPRSKARQNDRVSSKSNTAQCLTGGTPCSMEDKVCDKCGIASNTRQQMPDESMNVSNPCSFRNHLPEFAIKNLSRTVFSQSVQVTQTRQVESTSQVRATRDRSRTREKDRQYGNTLPRKKPRIQDYQEKRPHHPKTKPLSGAGGLKIEGKRGNRNNEQRKNKKKSQQPDNELNHMKPVLCNSQHGFSFASKSTPEFQNNEHMSDRATMIQKNNQTFHTSMNKPTQSQDSGYNTTAPPKYNTSHKKEMNCDTAAIKSSTHTDIIRGTKNAVCDIPAPTKDPVEKRPLFRLPPSFLRGLDTLVKPTPAAQIRDEPMPMSYQMSTTQTSQSNVSKFCTRADKESVVMQRANYASSEQPWSRTVQSQNQDILSMSYKIAALGISEPASIRNDLLAMKQTYSQPSAGIKQKSAWKSYPDAQTTAVHTKILTSQPAAMVSQQQSATGSFPLTATETSQRQPAASPQQHLHMTPQQYPLRVVLKQPVLLTRPQTPAEQPQPSHITAQQQMCMMTHHKVPVGSFQQTPQHFLHTQPIPSHNPVTTMHTNTQPVQRFGTPVQTFSPIQQSESLLAGQLTSEAVRRLTEEIKSIEPEVIRNLVALLARSSAQEEQQQPTELPHTFPASSQTSATCSVQESTEAHTSKKQESQQEKPREAGSAPSTRNEKPNLSLTDLFRKPATKNDRDTSNGSWSLDVSSDFLNSCADKTTDYFDYLQEDIWQQSQDREGNATPVGNLREFFSNRSHSSKN